jgi:drug/metabolite transporter (DMT)-like permease
MTSRVQREAGDRHPFRLGTALALLSASLFGMSTPLLRYFGAHAGPFTTAALLYAGAALASAPRSHTSEAPLRKEHAPRVLVVAVFGAVVAPACLAWGLARTSGMLGSLLLASEAFFTALLAALFYREPIGARLGAALAVISLASALLVHGASSTGAGTLGALAVLGASLAWALDNTLTRPLADLDPRQVVLAKAGAGALLSLVLASREALPTAGAAAGLLVTGGLGYGVSLRLYLQAQRRIGAARTGSIFAVAPFVGAVAAWGAGDGVLDRYVLAASALVAIGLTLHLREQHSHEHAHPEMTHDHAHRHDDGHHDHDHEEGVSAVDAKGEHSHPHRHAPTRHAHPHAPDLHHRHGHEHE